MATKAKIALVNAFLKLVEENDYNKITVTNLVENCRISRQTFYYHFDDIDTMIEWAFENETKKICDCLTHTKLSDSADMFASFFNRYDTLITKAVKTSDCIKIYELIYKSFYVFLSKYLADGQGSGKFKGDDIEFLLSYLASASAGFIIREAQKEEKNYAEVIKKLANLFKIA